MPILSPAAIVSPELITSFIGHPLRNRQFIFDTWMNGASGKTCRQNLPGRAENSIRELPQAI
jgi:hypothetical protein